jgi:hypothetical protein
VTPPSAFADDGAWDLATANDRACFLGYISLPQVTDLGSTLWIESHGINKQIALRGTSLFAYLVSESAITPQNAAHVVTLHLEWL